jgi:alcohol dehydrogenase
MDKQKKSMKAWRLEKLGGQLSLKEVPVPETRAGSVLVKVENVALVSYLKAYTEGKLPVYNPPGQEFTMGSNAIGYIEAVGQDIWHLEPGQRVVISSHITARENVEDPAMILLGITRAGDTALPLQQDWPDGTLAEYVLVPAETVTPLDGLEKFSADQLAAVTRLVVPYGGLLKGRFAAGETIVINGATGSYGTAAVLLAVAMGAAKVIAAGRNEQILAVVAKAGGPRVITVKLSGDVQADAKALKDATGGGAHIAFDQVGNASDPNSTLAALYSLRRGGRLVLMGSMMVDFPIPYTMLMINSWEIIGNFMYPARSFAIMLDLVRCGLLDLSPIQPKTFAFEQLNEAMDAAANAGNFDSVIINCQPTA